MQDFKFKKDPAPVLGLVELDRVRLKVSVADKGRTLDAGLEGTVVFCHGTDAFEVEFDTINDDFFQIAAKDLEKAG